MKKLSIILMVMAFLFWPFFLSSQIDYSDYDKNESGYWIRKMRVPNANYFEISAEFEKFWMNRATEKGREYKLFKRWQSFVRNYVDENGKIQSPLVTLEEVKKFNQQYASDAILGQWTPLGPTQIPDATLFYISANGRISAIEFDPTDPNIIYAGTPLGGLWKTIDGGNNWFNLNTDAFTTLGVSAIAIDPYSPSTIYIGMGDKDGLLTEGDGIFKSTDGGATWIHKSFNQDEPFIVQKILIDPGSPEVLAVATDNGVFTSKDNGDSFTKANGIDGCVDDMVRQPDDNGRLYACNGGMFFMSADFGDNWLYTKYFDGHRGALAVTPANPDRVYMILSKDNKFKGFYLSENRGVSWQIRDTTSMGIEGQGDYNLDLAVDPMNQEIVYAGFVNMYKSTNGGYSWTRKTSLDFDMHADQHVLEFSPHNNRMYIGNDGGVYYTSNGCNSYVNISNGLQIAAIRRVDVCDDDPNYIVSGHQDGGCYATQSDYWDMMTGGDGITCKVDPNNSNIVYATVQGGKVYRSLNGPVTEGFFEIAGKDVNGINQEGSFLTSFVLDQSSSNIMFVGETDIWRSTNVNCPSANGVNWQNISSGQFAGNRPIELIEQSPVDGERLYMIQDDGIRMYRCDNAYSSNPDWFLLSNKPGWTTRWIEAHPTELNTVYLASDNSIYKSTDGGINWVDISGDLPNIRMLSILYHVGSNEGLYVGTTAGVYYKDADMSGWALFKSGLPLTWVNQMDINYSTNPPQLYAGTFGRGLWKTDVLPVFKPNLVNGSANVTISGTHVSLIQGIQNQSPYNTTGDFHTGFYLSENNIIGPGDNLIGVAEIPNIGPNGISQAILNTVDVAIVEPLIPEGTYYLGTYLDPYHEVDEMDETDNRYTVAQQVIIPANPPAPDNVQASDGTYSDKVTITWVNPTDDVLYYAVFRNTINDPASAVKISPTNWSSEIIYNDFTAPPGIDLYYWVKSARHYSGIRESVFSASNPGWRQLAPPANIQATDGQYSNKVEITWTASQNATHYRVYRGTVNNSALATNISGIIWLSTTLYQDLTASAGTIYYYWVKSARSNYGNRASEFSGTNTGWVAFATAPVVTASDGTYTDKIAVSWNTVSGAPYYKLFRNDVNNPETSAPITGWQTETTFNDVLGTTGTVYYYWVVAAADQNGIIATGYGSVDSGWKNFIPPANLQATDGTIIEQINISWSASSGASRYKVYRHTQGNFANASPISNWITATSFTDLTATPGLTLFFWVVAAGDTLVTISQPAGVESGWSLLATPDVSATKGVYGDHVRVTWEPVNGGIAYRVYRSLISSSVPVAITSWSTSLNFQYDDYTAVKGEQYRYYVNAARNTSGLRESEKGEDIGFANECGNMIEDIAYRSISIEGRTLHITTRIINEGPYSLLNQGEIAFALEDAAPFGFSDYMLGNVDIPPLAVGAFYDVNFSVDMATASPGPVSLGTWYVSCFTSWDFANCDANMNDDYVVWESMPFNYTNAMYGEYSVGPIAGEFGSLFKVISDLETRGISDKVIFNLEAGVYHEQIVLGEIEGCTVQHDITFRTDPTEGDTAEIIFTPSSINNYTVKLDHCSNISFKNLKLSTYGYTNYQSTYGRVFDISPDCHNIRIWNSLITGYTDDTYLSEDNAVIFSRSSNLEGIDIEGNTIRNGATAIYLEGMNLTTDPIMSPVIRDNTIEGFLWQGIFLSYVDDPKIIGNQIKSRNPVDDGCVGIFLEQSRNGGVIETNNIVLMPTGSSAKGIIMLDVNMDGSKRGLVANNMISIGGTGTNMYGVYYYKCYKTDFYYNSIHLFGSQDAISVCLLLDCGEDAVMGYDNNVMNNIFSNKAEGYCMVYNYNAFNHQYIAVSDFNEFKSKGDYLFWYKGSYQLHTIAEWNNLTGFDGNSYNIDFVFNSDVDLHLNSLNLDGIVYPLSGIIRDIDGDGRDPVHTDPGADEFTYVYPGFSLNLKSWLQGPFNNSTMNTSLNLSGYLPLSQPYNIDPWNYTGTESVTSIPNANVVDWVLLELRDAPSAAQATASTTIARKAGFLLKNGDIIEKNGSSLPGFNFVVNNGLYVVVTQRNHLSIMNSSAMPQSSGIYTWNYTSGVNQVYGGATAHKQIAPGIWGMISSDGNSDGMVNNMDKNNVWKVQAGLSGYYKGDFNMNGQVENTDKNTNWKPNSGSGSQVPN